MSNTAPTIDPQTFSIPEFTSNGTIVGTAVANDIDVGDILTFSVDGRDDQNAFNVDSSGIITVVDSTKLNYSTLPTSHILVRVTDTGGLYATALMTINLTMIPVTLTGYQLQSSQVQRSFIRYIDLTFSSSNGLDSLISANRIKLSYLALPAVANPVLATTPTTVNLFNKVSRVGSQVKFDFGPAGIGGNRDTNAGDGYYTLELDLDADGTFEMQKHFYRLLGDADGNRTVVLSPSGDLGKDTNGDGLVNATDTANVNISKNRTIGTAAVTPVDPNF